MHDEASGPQGAHSNAAPNAAPDPAAVPGPARPPLPPRLSGQPRQPRQPRDEAPGPGPEPDGVEDAVPGAAAKDSLPDGAQDAIRGGPHTVAGARTTEATGPEGSPHDGSRGDSRDGSQNSSQDARDGDGVQDAVPPPVHDAAVRRSSLQDLVRDTPARDAVEAPDAGPEEGSVENPVEDQARGLAEDRAEGRTEEDSVQDSVRDAVPDGSQYAAGPPAPRTAPPSVAEGNRVPQPPTATPHVPQPPAPGSAPAPAPGPAAQPAHTLPLGQRLPPPPQAPQPPQPSAPAPGPYSAYPAAQFGTDGASGVAGGTPGAPGAGTGSGAGSGAGVGPPMVHFPEMPTAPADWQYRAPSVPSWWHRHRRTLRALALITLLVLCGLMIFALVREQTGTSGLLVGLSLACFPVPLLLSAFCWLDAVKPAPWRNHLFAFAWGACAATLVAIIANGFATDWLASSVVVDSPGEADTLGATVIAPVIEETTKGVAVLLLFLYRRRHVDSVVSALTVAGITATGFAFTENVLYLGTAYGEDTALGSDGLHASATATTFFIRIVLAPFAHPLFTALTGIAIGMVATLPRRRRVLRWVLPFVGLFTAILLHAIWNGSASFADLTFIAVYGLFMIPVFGTLTWLAVWSRQHDLRIVRDTLSAYAAAGWFSEPEPWSLSSMRIRSVARSIARRSHGPAAARTVAEYQHFASALALLRARADQGVTAPDFAAREQELLHHIWQRRPLAGPPTVSAAMSMSRPYVPPPPPWYGHPVPPPGPIQGQIPGAMPPGPGLGR